MKQQQTYFDYAVAARAEETIPDDNEEETRTFGSDCDVLEVPVLTRQMDIIREYMLAIHPRWRTHHEISVFLNERHKKEGLKFPEPSVAAQLRHLRKRQFGSYIVKKQRRENDGVVTRTREYQVEPKD